MATTKKDTKVTEPDTQAATISAADAAEILQKAVGDLRQNWIQGALRVANIVNGGQTVGHGTYEDLRNLRANWEELERARHFLRRPKVADSAGSADDLSDQEEARKTG